MAEQPQPAQQSQAAAAPRYVQLPNGSYLEWPEGVRAEEFKAKAAKVGAPPDTRNAIQRSFDVNTTPQRGESLLESGLKSVVQGVGYPFVHPIEAARDFYESSLVPNMINAAKGPAQPWPDKFDVVTGLGNLLGGAALGAATGEGMGLAGGAVRDAAIGNPDIAALRGLRVNPGSPKSLSTLRQVAGARPYLHGAESLEDLQSRIDPAKAEIWGVYKQAVDAIGERRVQGPDGLTTVRQLEDERLQLSALNRELKSKTPNPEAIQLAQQKGMSQAQLLARERAVQAALDPELETTGINPKAIRSTFSNVAGIGSRISGQSTLAEKSQPYGLGKIARLNAAKPLQAPGQIASGLRDIAAGRPLFSGRPTDVNIREAFRTGGPKPDLGTFAPPRIAGLLPSPEYEISLPKSRDIGPRGRPMLFPAQVNPEEPLEPRSGNPMAPISDYPFANPHYLSGSEHPELSGRYNTPKGVLRTRDPNAIRANKLRDLR